MKKNPVGWFEIYVDDMSRAKKFYETVLGLTLVPLSNPSNSDMEMWAFPGSREHYGAPGALVKMRGKAAGHNSTLVYFSCEDCGIEESRVEQAGGRIQQKKMSIGQYGFISLVIDTETNMVGLHSIK